MKHLKLYAERSGAAQFLCFSWKLIYEWRIIWRAQWCNAQSLSEDLLFKLLAFRFRICCCRLVIESAIEVVNYNGIAGTGEKIDNYILHTAMRYLSVFRRYSKCKKQWLTAEDEHMHAVFLVDCIASLTESSLALKSKCFVFMFSCVSSARNTLL
jgi:hypothetical protein